MLKLWAEVCSLERVSMKQTMYMFSRFQKSSKMIEFDIWSVRCWRKSLEALLLAGKWLRTDQNTPNYHKFAF